MSYWYQPKLKDIDLTEEGDEIHIYLGRDEFGSIYAEVKVDDIKSILKEFLQDNIKDK